MSIAWKIAWAGIRRYPTRMALTSAAMIASACVVVWVVSGYDALLLQFGDMTSARLGRFDAVLVPDSSQNPIVADSVIDAIRNDPAVAETNVLSQTQVRVVKAEKRDVMESDEAPAGGPGGGGPGMGKTGGLGGPGGGKSGAPGSGGPRPLMFMPPTLVGTDADQPPYALSEGVWIDRRHGDRPEAALSSSAAQGLNIGVGDEVVVAFHTKEHRVKVIGIVEQSGGWMPLGSAMRPSMAEPIGLAALPAGSALYVTRALADRLTQGRARTNLVGLVLKPDAKAGMASLRKTWDARAAQADPPALFVNNDDVRAGLEDGMPAANARRQAWAATGMSLLAALFIIFTTLSMGVHERVRQFAVMRAVGLTRGQIAGIIAGEGIVLALIGWLGGLAAGWGLLEVVGRFRPEAFPQGVSLGVQCVLLAGFSAFGGASAASILPAWKAMSVQPLEAMAPRRSSQLRATTAAFTALLGVGLIGVNPLLVYLIPIPDAARYGLYEAVGCTSMAVGFLLLAPATILTAERLFGPLLARLLGLDPRLLTAQLSSNLGRTLGTTASLTVGLGLYAAMLVWGYSMLQPFVPGRWVPDVLVALQRGGIPDDVIPKVQGLNGVLPDQFAPLAVEQPRLADDVTGAEQRVSIARQDNVILVGLDPQTAFGGDRPLLKVDFVEGTPAEVLAEMKKPRRCVVPDHFLAASRLRIGDRFAVVPPESPDQRVEYTIDGAVSLPGWHWMTKFSGLRRRSGRSAALIFTSFDDVRRDFGLKETNFFWMNIDPHVGVDAIGAALQPIAMRHPGKIQPVNQQGTWTFGAQMFGPSVRISTPDDVRSRIQVRADGMIWAMCQLPLLTLLVTSVGVVNTVTASVRTRRWEFGILRAHGVTRLGLVRIILAEGVLIGLTTCLLSLGFGVLAGWCGTGITHYVGFFGGMAVPLIIPWGKLAFGFGAAMLLCLAAAVWPAISTGYTSPLYLLQAGRSET